MSLSSSLETRAKAFYNSLIPYLGTGKGKYGKEMLRKFYDYWSEPNRSKTKMRFEMQPTWDVGRRLATWHRNDDNSFGRRSGARGITIVDAVMSGNGVSFPDEPTVFGLLEEDGQG